MSDQEILGEYVEVWWRAVQDFTALLDEVPDELWDTATDLPGWDIRAVAAHTAHLESVLATGVEEQAEVGTPPHVSGMGFYTEIGVVNRRDTAPAEIVAEIRRSTRERYDALLADPPTDLAGSPPHVFGGVPWTNGVLLRNRPLDVWMHEQDVRRALDRPGGMDTPPAAHTADYLAEAFGYVLAKKAQAAPGTTAVLEIGGHPSYAFSITDAGRGQRLPEPPTEPDVRLSMDRETFTVLAGGRRPAQDGAVTISGDAELAATILARMATTP